MIFSEPEEIQLQSTSHSGDEAAISPISRAESSFKKLIRFHRLFHLSFSLLGLAELIAFFSTLTLLLQALMVSLSLCALFMTAFSYALLRLYLQNKKQYSLKNIADHFFSEVAAATDYAECSPESNVTMSSAFIKLAETLNDKSAQLISIPRCLKRFEAVMQLSYFSNARDDLYQLKESALKRAVEENIKFVKSAATSFEAHTSLANSYVLLSSLYGEWKQSATAIVETRSLEEKFCSAVERAIEEFKILSCYSPNDPWIHEQLAYSWRDLQRPEEEIKEYEIILRLKPHDIDTLHKLGVLNFRLGRNAQGLQLYEQLKKLHSAKAEALIKHYGERL